jgi:predicted negative regulator of RcsB-dependent stress response
MDDIATVLYICTAITTISAAVTVIVSWINKAKEPNARQNLRLDQLETKIEKMSMYLDNDNVRIKAIEEGNKVTQKALLALMSHAINGNDTDKLEEAKNSLEQYLINK